MAGTPKHQSELPDGRGTDIARALEVVRALVNYTDANGATVSGAMATPHDGRRLSQRKAAHLLFAGRSYQAVQNWLRGEPVPDRTVEWLAHALMRVDATEDDRLVRVLGDEIAIIVKR